MQWSPNTQMIRTTSDTFENGVCGVTNSSEPTWPKWCFVGVDIVQNPRMLTTGHSQPQATLDVSSHQWSANWCQLPSLLNFHKRAGCCDWYCNQLTFQAFLSQPFSLEAFWAVINQSVQNGNGVSNVPCYCSHWVHLRPFTSFFEAIYQLFYDRFGVEGALLVVLRRFLATDSWHFNSPSDPSQVWVV